ncbi:10944_t:CDS:2 [Ambispora leptoticha]|uniref:10944_t:CDS:1 n=1 Tax=Ambispora leptoticha TaxID=144679 RepID=A0A9N9F1M9_9GLOM|nr:10944_t:CDS:2 [Ambispora leptoticha]
MFDDEDFGFSNKHFKLTSDCVYEEENGEDFDQAQGYDPHQDLETREHEEVISSTVSDINAGQQQQHQETDAPQQEQSSQPQTPQRKKPGRKPNPASPALRKAQNRAAQRAFRERKERHLRELEDTIKTLRQNEYEAAVKHQKEIGTYRVMIENLKNENGYWKGLALAFETILNDINGNSEITSKIKTTSASPSRRSASQLSQLVQPQADVLQAINAVLALNSDREDSFDVASKSFLPSPTNSSTVMSPQSTPVTPSTTVGSPPNNFSLNEDLANDLSEVKPVLIDTSDGNSNIDTTTIDQLHESKPLITNHNGITNNNTTIHTSNNESTSTYLDYSNLFFDSYLSDYSILQSQEQQQSPVQLQIQPQLTGEEMQQLIALARLVRAPSFADVNPKLHFQLTQQQLFYLQQPHDPRIGMIPCLHLRARMIEHRDKYDLTKLCDLLIRKAKCHGDTMDPDAWEMPEEFFEEYRFLSFNYCRLKSNFYREHGNASKIDLTNYMKTAGSSNLYLVS